MIIYATISTCSVIIVRILLGTALLLHRKVNLCALSKKSFQTARRYWPSEIPITTALWCIKQIFQFKCSIKIAKLWTLAAFLCAILTQLYNLYFLILTFLQKSIMIFFILLSTEPFCWAISSFFSTLFNAPTAVRFLLHTKYSFMKHSSTSALCCSIFIASILNSLNFNFNLSTLFNSTKNIKNACKTNLCYSYFFKKSYYILFLKPTLFSW